MLKKAMILLGGSVLACVVQAEDTAKNKVGKISGNEFNPAVSVILDGRYTDIKEGELHLPGFQLGGEAGLPEQGFSSPHNELMLSANVDDKFYGSLTAAIYDHDGESGIELEEAFIETLGLGAGFTIKAGKFLSGLGYLNSVHGHAHDFTDSPLVYDALFGGHLIDTGVQVSWVAPLDFYLNVGAELLTGANYPSGENNQGDRGQTAFIKVGSDIGQSVSWQLGTSYFSSNFDEREAGGHDHGHDHGHGGGDLDVEENALEGGEVDIAGVDFVLKWRSESNPKAFGIKWQTEFFQRNEKAEAHFEAEDGSGNDLVGMAEYDGKQQGAYTQLVFQFHPKWKTGIRYDYLKADNKVEGFDNTGTTGTLSEDDFLENTSLGDEGVKPQKYTWMISFAPSHFSVLRLQASQIKVEDEEDTILSLQYVMSLGSHGAHGF